MNSIPNSVILGLLVFVVLPALIAIRLRWVSYRYLNNLNQDLSRLFGHLDHTIVSEQLHKILDRLRQRYEAVSLKTDRVNTIALVEVVYDEQLLRCWPIPQKLSLESINAYTRTLPNWLLSFGLIGTFWGITDNLVSLGRVVDTSQTSNVGDLIKALQSPLEGMGVAFVSSLGALVISAFLIGVNLFLNIDTEKNVLMSGFENYLDNIYQVNINGETRLDKTVDRMADTFDHFLKDFGESLKNSVESALKDKIEEISHAYIQVANLASQSYVKFNDTSNNISQSADRFLSASLVLQKAAQDIQDSQFAPSLAKTVAALKATLSDFEISSQRLAETVNTVDRYFSQSHISLAESITQLASTQNSFTAGIDTLHTTVGNITQGTELFQASAIILGQSVNAINTSEFAKSLSSATTNLNSTVVGFQSSSKQLAETITGVKDLISLANNQLTGTLNNLQLSQNNFATTSKNLDSSVSSLHENLEKHLFKQIETLSTTHKGIADLAGKSYEQLNKLGNIIEKSAVNLQESAQVFHLSAQSLSSTNFDQSLKTFSQGLHNMGFCAEKLQQAGAGIEKSAINLQNSAQVLHSSAQSLSSTNFDQSLKTLSQGLNNMGFYTEQFQKTFQSMENHSFVQSLLTSTTTIANGVTEIQNSNKTFQESRHVSTQQKFMAIDKQITKATEKLDNIVVKVESINAVNHHLLAIRKAIENASNNNPN